LKRITKDRKFDWDEFYYHKGSYWRDKDYRFLTTHFDPKIFKGDLLDVGCGVADGIRYLKGVCTNATRFIGMDFSEEAMKINREHHYIHNKVIFWEHSLTEPFFTNVDNVICLQTLEHLQDPIKGMKHLISMTKKILIVSTPYKNRRPDIDHMWSFDENDFKEQMDSYVIGENESNIYWRLEKNE